MNRNIVLLVAWLVGLLLFFIGLWNMSQRNSVTLTLAFFCLFVGMALFTYPLTALQERSAFRL